VVAHAHRTDPIPHRSVATAVQLHVRDGVAGARLLHGDLPGGAGERGSVAVRRSSRGRRRDGPEVPVRDDARRAQHHDAGGDVLLGRGVPRVRRGRCARRRDGRPRRRCRHHDDADPARRHRPPGPHRLRRGDQPGHVRGPRGAAHVPDHRVEPRGEEGMTTTNPAIPETPVEPPRVPPTASASTRRRAPRRSTVVRYVLLGVMLVMLARPLLWQLSMSLKGPADDLYQRPPQLIPSDFTLSNFTEVIDRIPVLTFVLNSFIVAALVIGGNIVLATLAGYALARLRWKLRPVATGVFVAAMLVPLEAIIIAQFLLVRSMGLTDTLFAVALPMLVTPLNVLLMRNAFLGIPDEMEEAAVVDGANAWQRFLRICVPQVKGVISVVAIFAFVGSWNDFLWPLIVLTSEQNFTLTVGLNYLRGTFYDDPRLIAAGTIIALIPIIAL